MIWPLAVGAALDAVKMVQPTYRCMAPLCTGRMSYLIRHDAFVCVKCKARFSVEIVRKRYGKRV